MSMEANIILLILLTISVLGKADSVSIAIAVLLILRLVHIENLFFPIIEKNGIFIGLIFLTSAILIPIASGSITSVNIKNNFLSITGIIALTLSFLTTYLSGVGLKYLSVNGHSDVMPALILGSVAAAAFLGGVPVGPLITSGMLAIVMRLFHKT